MTPGSLSAEQVDAYHRDGYLYPLDGMPQQQAAAYLRKLEALQAQYGPRAAQILRSKSHLVLTWVDALIRLPRVLDAVQSLIGPDIFCWSTSFFIKEAQDPGFVAWHQDGPYSGTPEGAGDIVTAWIALTPSVVENGCLKVVAGSHKTLVEHVYKENTANLLSLGQEIAVEVDDAKATRIALQPGQFSFHHEKIFHGSAPNTSAAWRVGLAVRYIKPHARTSPNTIDHATLVRGEDRYDTFFHDPSPPQDMHPASVEYLDSVLVKKFGNRYRRVTAVVADKQ